jgi:diacylglycerol O-acyltransferase
MRKPHPDAVSSNQAPRCVLNSKITGSRRFSAQSYSTARIKHIANACGATSNDTVLALCGAALRIYLLEMNALPEKPLIAVVPMSTRRDESDTGNEITMGLVNLATDLSDPLIRLKRVKASMDHSKSRLRGLTPGQVMAQTLTRFMPGAMTLLPGLGSKNTVANVVISHVRGPQTPVYWQGCELDGIFPASLLVDGFALNITLISRYDFIDFGVIACRKSLPGIQRLLEHFETAIVDLEKSLGPKAQAVPTKRRAA